MWKRPSQGPWRLALLATLSFVFGSVQASPILGEPIFGGQLKVASDGPVFAEYLGFRALYRNTLYFLGAGDVRPTDSIVGARALFTTKGRGRARRGDRELLGYFEEDQMLWFGLEVHNTGHVFFSGDASLNPDGVAHAVAVTFADSAGGLFTDLGFEDLYSGGDRDFNDLRFRLTNVIDPPPAAIPAPAPLTLLVAGLAALATTRSRRRFWRNPDAALVNSTDRRRQAPRL